MRKRIVATVLIATLACLFLMGAAAPAKSLDLTGNWEEKDKGDSYQAGYIKDGEIVIYWVSDGGDTKSLYWAGSYIAPTDNAEPYTWNSENDKEKLGPRYLLLVTTQRSSLMKMVKLLTRHLL